MLYEVITEELKEQEKVEDNPLEILSEALE